MSGGAPWWLTILLIVATNAWSIYNERKNSAKKWRDEWRSKMQKDVYELADSASKHYTQADAIKNTKASAALLLNSLNRLQAHLEEASFLDGKKFQEARSALRCLKVAISDDEDFQNPKRVPRAPNDPLLLGIRARESDFLIQCSATVTKRAVKN